ncbi:MAG: DUF362 domain-containing protein [Pseudomonadota bacterium]
MRTLGILLAVLLPSIGLAAPRVVSVHDARATNWDYATGSYYESRFVDQAIVDAMFLKGMQLLTGKSTTKEAWQALLPHWAAGQKIAIKVNFNNGGNANTLDSTPQPIHSLVASLLDFGFQLSQIRVFDASRPIANWFRTQVGYPALPIFDCNPISCTWNYSSNDRALFSSSDPGASVTFATYTGSHKITDVLIGSDYLVNACIFQRHGGAVVSLALKNHFGTIDGLYTGGHTIHDWMVPWGAHYGGTTNNPIVDINLNSNIRNKTVLVLGDGLYGDWPDNNGVPHRWVSFGNDSPNSLFFGVDPVATDSVMIDRLEWEGSFGYWGPQATDLYVDAENRGLGVHEVCGFSKSCSRIDFASYDFDSGTQTGTPVPEPTATPGPTSTANPGSTSTPTPAAKKGSGCSASGFGELSWLVCLGLGWGWLRRNKFFSVLRPCPSCAAGIPPRAGCPADVGCRRPRSRERSTKERRRR